MKSKIRVLIVDDNEGVRRDIQTALLMMAKIEVAGSAENGLEAVELTKKLNPDVVLMDLEMPGMNGMKASQTIKSLGLGTVVIMLSVHSSDSIIQRAMEAGADGFIEKGTPIQMLEKIIHGLFKKR